MSSVQRHQSEYSVDPESSVSHSSQQSAIKVDDNEKHQARGRLYSVLFHNWKALVGIVPTAAQGAAPILLYLVFGHLLTAMSDWAFYGKDPMHDISINCVYIFLIALLSGTGKFLDSMLWIQAGSELSVKIRQELFRNMMKSEVAFFDVNPIGGILTLLSEDSQLVQDAFGQIKGLQLVNMFQFLLGLILAYVYSWKLALIATAAVPIIAITLGFFVPPIVKHSIARFRRTASSMTIAEETLAAIRTVRGFNREETEIQRFREETVKVGKHEKAIVLSIGFMMAIVMSCVWAAVLINLWYGSLLIGTKQNGKIFVVGDLFSVFGYTIMGCMGIIQVQATLQGEEKAISAGARILKLTAHVPSIPFEGGEILDNFTGHIEFRNVSFKYPTRDAYVLKNVSWEVKAGQMGALVGHSGSGKSTSVQLLERYYDAEEGVILLDGHDIKTLDPRWLHHQIALVSQEPSLFKMTVKENILYGAEEGTTMEQVISAAEIANAAKFIDKFDHKYDEMVGGKGSSLSGGQRQRIAIARAVIKNPVVLITDEATSALDAESEKKVQKALDKVMEGRTAIIVAHRLSTIRNAQVIYVFDSGEIKEVGTHDSLVKKGGWYYNLVKRQLTAKDTEAKDQHDAETNDTPKASSNPELKTEKSESESEMSESSSSHVNPNAGSDSDDPSTSVSSGKPTDNTNGSTKKGK